MTKATREYLKAQREHARELAAISGKCEIRKIWATDGVTELGFVNSEGTFLTSNKNGLLVRTRRILAAVAANGTFDKGQRRAFLAGAQYFKR